MRTAPCFLAAPKLVHGLAADNESEAAALLTAEFACSLLARTRPGIRFCALSLPLLLGRIPHNWGYGVRTPVPLANNQNWHRANRVGGGALLLAGLTQRVPYRWMARSFARNHRARPEPGVHLLSAYASVSDPWATMPRPPPGARGTRGSGSAAAAPRRRRQLLPSGRVRRCAGRQTPPRRGRPGWCAGRPRR